MDSIPTKIELILNGDEVRYDWQCPVCDEGHGHYEDAHHTEEVMCYTCGNSFEVNYDQTKAP